MNPPPCQHCGLETWLGHWTRERVSAVTYIARWYCNDCFPLVGLLSPDGRWQG